MFLLLTLNTFLIWFYCYYCWIQTNKCWLSLRNYSFHVLGNCGKYIVLWLGNLSIYMFLSLFTQHKDAKGYLSFMDHFPVSSFPIIIYDNGAPYPAFLKSFQSVIISQDNMHPNYIIKLWSHYFAPCIFYSFLLFDTLVNNLHHSKDQWLAKWL